MASGIWFVISMSQRFQVVDRHIGFQYKSAVIEAFEQERSKQLAAASTFAFHDLILLYIQLTTMAKTTR